MYRQIPRLRKREFLHRRNTLNVTRRTLTSNSLVSINLRPLLTTSMMTLLTKLLTPTILSLPTINNTILIRVSTTRRRTIIRNTITNRRALQLNRTGNRPTRRLTMLRTIKIPMTINTITVQITIATRRSTLPNLRLTSNRIFRLLLQRIRPRRTILSRVPRGQLTMNTISYVSKQHSSSNVIIRITTSMLIRRLLQNRTTITIMSLINVNMLRVRNLKQLTMRSTRDIMSLYRRLLTTNQKILTFTSGNTRLRHVLTRLTIRSKRMLNHTNKIRHLQRRPKKRSTMLFSRTSHRVPLTTVKRQISRRDRNLTIIRLLHNGIGSILGRRIYLFRLIMRNRVNKQSKRVLRFTLPSSPLTRSIRNKRRPTTTTLLLINSITNLSRGKRVRLRSNNNDKRGNNIQRDHTKSNVKRRLRLQTNHVTLLGAYRRFEIGKDCLIR